MGPTLETEFRLAKEVAIEAGEITLRYFRNSYQIHEKEPDQPVTTADLKADRYLRETLLNSFPKDGWLSEETRDSSERLSKERVWIIDPLDGTKEFIADIPEYTISVALTIERRPVLGVIYNPNTRELFAVRKGMETQYNHKSVQCSNRKKLNEASLFVSRSEMNAGFWRPYEKQFDKILPCGSTAYKLARIAIGHGDLYISFKPKNEWDICAGDALLRGAGGTLVTFQSETILYNHNTPHIASGIIAGPHLLVDQAHKLLNSQTA